MNQIVEFSILAPELDNGARKMLRIVMQKSGLDYPGDHARLEDCATRHVLSVGKAGLDAWHEYGIIGIGLHHGNLFRHWDSLIGHRIIMPIHHPALLLQTSFGGYEAKDQMLFDLARWRGVVEGEVAWDALRQMTCGKCGTRRGKGGSVSRPAEHWVAELDGCGLCEDCYRGRAKIGKKVRGKKPKPGTREAQMPGQMEMLPGDGTRIVVSKR